jgi:hypothetical protein
MDNLKIEEMKAEFISKVSKNFSYGFEKLIEGTSSIRDYHELESSVYLAKIFKQILKNYFYDANLKSSFEKMKDDILISANKHCEHFGYELTKEHLKTLDNWLEL